MASSLDKHRAILDHFNGERRHTRVQRRYPFSTQPCRRRYSCQIIFAERRPVTQVVRPHAKCEEKDWQVMQRLHPPLGRVGNERKRVSGEGGWNTDRAASHPPRRLVPRLRPSRREGELHHAMEGAVAASDQTTGGDIHTDNSKTLTNSASPCGVRTPVSAEQPATACGLTM